MSICKRIALVIAVLLASTAASRADDSPLPFFTEQVDLLIRLREPDQTMERVTQLINKIQPGVGDQLKSQQSQALGQLISNPDLTGVDQSRDWYVGVYGNAEAPPEVVFAIPAIKPEDLVAAVGPDMTTQIQGRWVLYTDAESIPAPAEGKSASTQLSAEQLKQLATGDLCVYVNIAHLSEVYAEQIELAQDKVLEALNQLRFLPQESGVNIQAMIEVYGSIAESFFQGIEDGQSSILSLELTEQDLSLTKHVTFASDSASAKFLASNPTSDLALLNKLPGGAPIYYGFSGDIRGFLRYGMKMSLMMSEKEDALSQLDEQLKTVDEVTFGPGVALIDVVNNDQGILRVASIIAAEPIAKVREFNRAMAATMGTVETPAFKQTTTLQQDAETFGPYKADVGTATMEYNEDTDPSGIQEKMQQAMFGEGGVQSRTLYLDDKGLYAMTVGGGQPGMQKLLDSLDSTKPNGLEKYRQAVSSEVNLLMFLDLARFFGNILRSASQLEEFPLPINAQMIDSLNLKTSYITLAAGSKDAVLTTEFRLPIEQIVGLTKLGVLVGTSLQGAL